MSYNDLRTDHTMGTFSLGDLRDMNTALADGQRESMGLQHTPKDNTNSTSRALLGYASFTASMSSSSSSFKASPHKMR